MLFVVLLLNQRFVGWRRYREAARSVFMVYWVRDACRTGIRIIGRVNLAMTMQVSFPREYRWRWRVIVLLSGHASRSVHTALCVGSKR